MPATRADKITRSVLVALGKLPTSERVMRLLAGKPVRIDGQTLHPGVQIALKVINANPDTFENHPVAQAREELDVEAWLFGTEPPVARVEEIDIPGPTGDIPARVYQDGDDPAGMLMYMHGGGWVLGGIPAADAVCREIARRTGLVVVNVDYRLAPENPFPAAVDDAIAAFRWLRDNHERFGYPEGRIAVAGESAGGNLTCVVAQQTAKDPEGGPAFQCPIFPVTDLSTKARSYRLFSEGYFLTQKQMDWYKAHYLTDESEALDPRVSPLLAEDVSDVAPACVVVAGFDPLRDDGINYAKRLQAAGVPTELYLNEGFIHGFVDGTVVGSIVTDRIDHIAKAILAGLR